mgnify:CR=1 FL=1
MSENTEKVYDLRPLVATDMGTICNIISAIGIKEFRNSFNLQDFKGMDVEAVGIGVFFDLAGIVISNIPKAEPEIQAFIASLTGMQLSEVKQMPFADYGELIIQVIMKDDFQDFFKRVMKLFNR